MSEKPGLICYNGYVTDEISVKRKLSLFSVNHHKPGDVADAKDISEVGVIIFLNL